MIDNAIMRAVLDETGVTIASADAAAIRRELLDGRTAVQRPVVYVTRAIRNEPRRFLPASARSGPPPVAALPGERGTLASEQTKTTAAAQVRARLAQVRGAAS